ncbi:hypothetical protein IH992_04125 [Candidatus Poribacteria bacterium]|nr:hypothetical protein [Candidatus Poribacteria bacterium]
MPELIALAIIAFFMTRKPKSQDLTQGIVTSTAQQPAPGDAVGVRRYGQMTFALKTGNTGILRRPVDLIATIETDAPDPVSFPVNLRSGLSVNSLTDYIQFVIVPLHIGAGSSPSWFANLLALTTGQASKVFAVINGLIQQGDLGEVDPNRLPVPIIRRTALPVNMVGGKIFLFNKGSRMISSFRWDGRNSLGERVASGTYFALAYLQLSSRQYLTSGWIRFVIL